MLSVTVYYFFQIVFILLMIYVVLTWIPRINWYNEPFRTLKAFCDLFFEPFRRLIPPIGMIDISPIVAFFVLSLIRNIIVSLLVSLHL